MLEDAAPPFIKQDEWPPYSPNCNSMDYYMLKTPRETSYEDRMNTFTEDEAKSRNVEKMSALRSF